MISYVLLIFITISLSIGVYIWLKDYANIDEKINCKEGTSLTIEKYNIEEKSVVNKQLNLTIKNNGLFNVSGFLISAGNDSRKIPMQLLWPRYQPQPYAGYFDFEPELGPGQRESVIFNVTDINKLEIIQIQPYILKTNNIDKIFCEQALIKQVTLINPSSIKGLVSWWKFDGNSLDYDYGNDGTNEGNPVYVNGRLNQGLKFDGVDDSVNVGSSSSLQSNVFTYSAWIKPLSGSTSTNRAIIGNFNEAVEFRVRTDNTIELLHQSAGSIGISTGKVSNNIWSHVLVTYNSSGTASFYINGTYSGSNVNLKSFTWGGDFYIGRQIGGDFFNGTIDELAIYNRALSNWEVLQLYNSYNITSE